MTITESTAQPRTSPSGLVPITFDFYKDIHKAIRVELFELVSTAGRADPRDGVAVADLAAQLAQAVDFLEDHAHHEDQSVQPLIAAHRADLDDRIQSDHAEFDDIGVGLVARAVEITMAPEDHRRRLLHWLYLDLASFTSRYFAHQDLEERLVMPALEAAVGPDTVLAVHGELIATMPPDVLMQGLARMFPAMNIDDRCEMLGGMRAEAPPEAFAGVWSLFSSVLDPTEVAAVSARLGLS